MVTACRPTIVHKKTPPYGGVFDELWVLKALAFAILLPALLTMLSLLALLLAGLLSAALLARLLLTLILLTLIGILLTLIRLLVVRHVRWFLRWIAPARLKQRVRHIIVPDRGNPAISAKTEGFSGSWTASFRSRGAVAAWGSHC